MALWLALDKSRFQQVLFVIVFESPLTEISEKQLRAIALEEPLKPMSPSEVFSVMLQYEPFIDSPVVGPVVMLLPAIWILSPVAVMYPPGGVDAYC